MNTKLLMSCSAITLGLVGMVLTFAPDDILGILNLTPHTILKLALQLIGALYIAFAMLNWMTRNTLIGGIFAKPITMANGAHFFIGAMALIKVAMSVANLLLIWVMCAVYTYFAVCFLYVAFTAPKEKKVTV